MALVDPNRIKASIAEDKVVNRPGGIMQPKFSLGKVVEKPSVFNFDYWREEKAPLLAAWMKMDPKEKAYSPDPSLTFGNLAPFKPMEDLFPRTSVGFPKDEPKAITTFAPEGEGLSGRLDGQLGYSKETARQGDGPANAVAAALGRNVAASDAAPVVAERSGLMAKQNQALRDYTRSRIEGSMTAPESASMYDAAKWSNLYDKDDNFSNSRALKALKSSIPNDTQRALLEGVFKVEVGNNGPKSELGYGNLTGAQAASDPRTRGTDANSAGVLPPETIARRAAFRALDNNPAFTNGSSTTRSAMIFDIFYNDANRTDAYKLGNTQDGDGSLFQGRGFTQITGRDNYTAVQNKLAEQGIDVDLLTNPELVNDRRYALPAALAFWDHIGLNADTASSFSAKKLNNKVNSGEGAAKAKERWGYVVSSLRSAGNADEADAMELRNEYAAQEKVGLSGDSVDGSIGNTSKTAMNTWLTSRGVNVPDGIDTMDLVILVNSTPVEAD